MPATTHTPDLFAPSIGVPLVRPICTGESDLTLWDPYNEHAWLACEDAPHLRDYR